MSCCEKLLSSSFERVETRVIEILHLDLKASSIAETPQRRRRQHEHTTFLDGGELLPDRGQQTVAFEFRTAALGELIEDEKGRAHVGLVSLQNGGVPRDGEGVGDAGDLSRHGIHAAHDGVGALEGGGIRKLNEDDGVTHVLGGNVAAGHLLKNSLREENQARVAEKDQQRQADQFTHQARVEFRAEVKDPVEKAEEPAEKKIDEPGESVRFGSVGLQ